VLTLAQVCPKLPIYLNLLEYIHMTDPELEPIPSLNPYLQRLRDRELEQTRLTDPEIDPETQTNPHGGHTQDEI